MKPDLSQYPKLVQAANSPGKIYYQIGEVTSKESCALVIPTNCRGETKFGFLDKVNALFPYNQKIYQAACANNSMRIGDVLSVKNNQTVSTNPYFIINVPLKHSWDDELTLDNLAKGLEALVVEVDRLGLSCVSLPVWDNKTSLSYTKVNHLFESILLNLPYVDWYIFSQNTDCS